MSELFEPIAVVGMAARFPGATDIREYWRNLSQGIETVSFPSDEELRSYGVTPAELADPAYVKAVPLMPDVDGFDAEFFGLTPRDAEICDPQIRAFLEIAHSTIEDAGYDTSRIGEGVGVFGATGPSRYGEMYVLNSERYPREPLNLWTLNNVDYLSTLASYKLNLRGPSFTMATACSSSLVALHLACQSLRVGECDVALTGGSTVNLPYGHGHFWAPGGVKSPDGHCRPFDAAGTGTIFGNGAAAVMLKRLSDAVADGDCVRAVIRGTAINNDGADKVSFSAPSVTGQAAAIMEAMVVAGAAPHDISYVEAHATGTALGDPVEIAALTTAYRRIAEELPPAGSIAIGSVKGNIGHLVWAAGVASLIKVVLSLEGEQLPASINYSAPNPKMELDSTPFFVNDSLRPWKREEGRVRRAGISSLGIGGTNAHVVVEEGPLPRPTPSDSRPRIVIWSGRSQAAADANRVKLAGYFAESGGETFVDAVATLQRGRRAHPIRGAAVCATADEAARALTAGEALITAAGPAPEGRGVAHLFPGQGAQHARMAAGLYGSVPAFTEHMDVCLEAFERAGVPLYDSWLDADGAEHIQRTGLAQPLLFAVEHALAQTWSEWGMAPQAVLGHSIGEMVAATVAGVFRLDDAVRLVAARAEAMQAAPEGGMLAVPRPEDEVRELLPESVTVAVVNPGPQTVVGGPPAQLRILAERLSARGVPVRPLRTSHAFHTAAMRDAAARFAPAFDGVDLRPPSIPIYSAATGARLSDAEAVDPSFWAGQIATPVWFQRAVDAMAADRGGILLEAGPGRALTGLIRNHAPVRDHFILVPSLREGAASGRDDLRDLLTAAARLWVAGAPIDWAAVNRGEPLQRVSVPGYQYQRKRYWVEPVKGPAAPSVSTTADTAETADTAPGTPFTAVTWVEQARPPIGVRMPSGQGRALALVPEDTAAALRVTTALAQAGYEVTRVRPGAEFTAHGDEFRVRPGEPADLGRLVDALASGSRLPDLLVHAWSVPDWPAATADSADGQLDLAVLGLIALVQEIGRRPGAPPDLLVLTARSVDVAGGERVDAVKAATHGLARTLALESPDASSRIVDIGPGVGEDDLIDEISLPDGPPLVALRGRRRWVPREQPYTPVAAPSPLRRDGVYLITGGLGGLGLAVAKGLAGTGRRPRLALLGRRGPSDAHRQALAELASLGAEVKVVTCDVADRRALSRALDIVTAHFGPPNGVFHLAGVAGDGMIQRRRLADARDVLRPKVHGTLLLGELLGAHPPLDFFVSFSSRAALRGLVGSGDYSAANAFLDAWAGTGDAVAVRHLSIDWPAWSQVGMAAGKRLPVLPTADRTPHQTVAPVDDERHHTVVLSAEECWALDEHRFGGQAVLPGTGHLDLVVTALRRLVADRAGVPVRMDEVVFAKPLIGDVAREVRIGFAPDGDRHRFRVISRPQGTDEPWQQHVTGHIAAAAPAPRRLAVDDLRSGLPEASVPSFTPAPGAFLTLGPRWQGTTGMWAENGTKLVRIRLPEPFATDLPDHPLHPAIMDLATALVRDRDTDAPHLPFLYRSLVLHADLPAEVLSYIRRRPDAEGVIVGDIDVVAPDGTVLVEIEGFTMRVLKDPSVVAGNGARGDAPAVEDSGAAEGIATEAGVRALLTLLEARTPGQVAVQPGLDPFRPVAIPEPAVPRPARPARAAVPVPAAVAEAAPAPTGAVAPVAGGTVLDELRTMWREAIGVNEIDQSADFFDIGGDSLSAVQVMGRVRDHYGIALSIGILFDHPTLGELAGVVAEQVGR